MDYKKKYLKYNKKYKNLLKLNGGAAAAAADDPDLIRALEESMKTLQLQQPQMAEVIRRSKTVQEPNY